MCIRDRLMTVLVALETLPLDRSLTVPILQLGQRHRASDVLTLAGGKGINIARALKRLDVPVVATGLAGGRTGTRIVEELTGEAILNDFVRIRDESRTSTLVVDPTSGRQTEINEWGPKVSEAELGMLMDKLRYLSRGADAVVFAGSLPRGVSDTFYADAARERAGEDDRRGAAAEVAELLEQGHELVLRHLRAPFVDLGVRPGGRVDDGRRRARLVADPDEVVEDRLLRQLLDDPRPRAAAGETGRDDRDVEPLQRTSHVDPLAAGQGEHAARPVPVPELEDRDRERAVERSVEGDGDDQCRSPFLTIRMDSHETRPARW